MNRDIHRFYRAASAALLFLAVLSGAVLSGCSRSEAWQWDLVFEDEFEGDAGQLPESTIWNFDEGTDWGNNQLEYDTSRPENVSLDGYGHLAITAIKERYLDKYDYTSGRINTYGNIEYKYGKFEARIKLPVGQGIWPAFWLLGSNFKTDIWPSCGEIDIMEYKGQEPTVLNGSLHGPGYSGGSAITRRLDLGEDLSQDYHVYSVEWSQDRIAWFLDGRLYLTVTRQDIPSGTEWVFDHPFFIILNVAVGGNFVGSPDETTQFPQTMLVDWVRVYKGE